MYTVSVVVGDCFLNIIVLIIYVKPKGLLAASIIEGNRAVTSLGKQKTKNKLSVCLSTHCDAMININQQENMFSKVCSVGNVFSIPPNSKFSENYFPVYLWNERWV